MMQFFGWCVCLLNFSLTPSPSKKGRQGELEEYLVFFYICENRDMSSDFVPLMLVGYIKFVLDERR